MKTTFQKKSFFFFEIWGDLLIDIYFGKFRGFLKNKATKINENFHDLMIVSKRKTIIFQIYYGASILFRISFSIDPFTEIIILN